MNKIQSCHCCGLVQRLPEFKAPFEPHCFRCDSKLGNQNNLGDLRFARASALAALLCYPLAMGLPALEVEQLGHHHESSIFSGMCDMFSDGHWVLGLIILICSIVLPLAKLSGILILASDQFIKKDHHRAITYRMIEWSGRWGMIDVLLIAALVALVKLGDLVTIHPGPGVWAFSACVIFSLMSSSYFDPHAMWKEKL